MGDELLKKLSPDEAEQEQRYKSRTELFEKSFPSYLAIGMSYNEYWYKDASLVRSYREAEKMKAERENSRCWMQGAYIYEAICSAFPLFNPYVKDHKALPYPKAPHSLSDSKMADTPKKAEEAEMIVQKSKFDKIMRGINAKFENKAKSGEITNG